MNDDQWFRDALTTTDDDSPRPGFRADLRARLSDEWHGRETLAPAARTASGRPWWTIGAAAASVTALLVAGLVWLASRPDDRIAPPSDSPAPAPTAAPAPESCAGRAEGLLGDLYRHVSAGEAAAAAALFADDPAFEWYSAPDRVVGATWDPYDRSTLEAYFAEQYELGYRYSVIGVGRADEAGGTGHFTAQLQRVDAAGVAEQAITGGSFLCETGRLVAMQVSEWTPAGGPVAPPTMNWQALADWVRTQAAAGRDQFRVSPGEGTAAMVVWAAVNGESNTGPAAALVLPGGDVVDLPHDEFGSPGHPTQFGDTIAVVSATAEGPGLDGDATLILFDPASGDVLQRTPLGLGAAPTSSVSVDVRLVGDTLLVGRTTWTTDADGTRVPDARPGVRISPDLAITPIAEPPAGLPMQWTSATGSKAFLLGREGFGPEAGIDTGPPLTSPWAYDPATDTWTEVPNPDWLACDPECTWEQPREHGDARLELTTPTGVVRLLPDGSIGLLDAASLTWIRLGDAPFPLENRHHDIVGNRWVVSLPFDCCQSGSEPTLGVFDLVSLAWSTSDMPAGWPIPTNWERTGTVGGAAVFWPRGDDVAGTVPLALDLATGELRPADADEVTVAARQLSGVYTVDELLAILSNSTPEPTPPTTQPVPADTSCFASETDPAVVVEGFMARLITARLDGSLAGLGACLTEVPARFTGAPPYCWEDACADSRAFVRDGLRQGEVTGPDGVSWWTASLPVSYLTLGSEGFEFADVVETWEFRPVDDGWAVSLSSVDAPLPQRQESLAAINAYLAAVAGGDWVAAAEMLQDGGANPEDRTDIQELSPDTFDTAGIAAALQRWCDAGCDTTPAMAEDVSFTGGYEYAHNGQTIRATWYEGTYGVYGPPILTGAPDVGPDLMADWPAVPTPLTLGSVPYLVPGADVGDVAPIRSEGEGTSGPASYQQLWVDPNVPGRRVRIASYPGQSAFHQNTRAVTVPGWDDARASWMFGGHVGLTLGEPSGYVTLQATGISEWSALDLADGLVRLPDGPGWELGERFEAWVLIAEAWNSGYAGRSIRWPGLAELQIDTSGVERFLTAEHFGSAGELVDFDDGRQALLFAGDSSTVAWEVAPGVAAVFGYHGPGDEALAIARSIQPVDQATWEAYAAQDTFENDGCNSMFC
ncbi:MAG TPA: hypothetical protein VNQ73_09560 [Ilumatobacter sp.]|nr:hypothetical protein [Ilumatobacter sp.]